MASDLAAMFAEGGEPGRRSFVRAAASGPFLGDGGAVPAALAVTENPSAPGPCLPPTRCSQLDPASRRGRVQQPLPSGDRARGLGENRLLSWTTRRVTWPRTRGSATAVPAPT